MTISSYKLQISLKSDTLIGSGEGFGSIIDTDVVFDSLGLPFIPGRRLKGCLRESANQVCHMLSMSNIVPNPSKTSRDGRPEEYSPVVNLFGKPGARTPARLRFFNYKLEDPEKNQSCLQELTQKFPGIVTRDSILQFFTCIRQQTAIDDTTGTAKPHALRTIRVVKKDFTFSGTILLDGGEAHPLESEGKWSLTEENLLALACLNLRRIGSKRNRGFGEVECRLFKDNGPKDNGLVDPLDGMGEA